MLWLPKWLKDNGDQVEAAMPSRRRFLILGAAAAVGAMVPQPTSPFRWKDPLPVKFIQGRVRIASMSNPWALDGVWVQALKSELAATALDIEARGLAGMVEQRGLYVPEHMQTWPDWRKRLIGEWAATPPPDPALYRGEWAQPAHDDYDYARDCVWLGIDRGRPDGPTES